MEGCGTVHVNNYYEYVRTEFSCIQVHDCTLHMYRNLPKIHKIYFQR